MTRLRKKAFETEPTQMTDSMIPLEEMDEADVRMDRCPNCRHYPLEKVEGFKKCPICNSTYKNFDGEGYIIAKRLLKKH